MTRRLCLSDCSAISRELDKRFGLLRLLKPLLPLLVLAAVGIALEAAGVFDWHAVLAWGRGVASWPLALGIVVTQILLYLFAQPGSALFWVAALLYAPPVATLILTAGGTLGALAAYAFARQTVQSGSMPQGALKRLARHGDFFALCLLRLAPGMPHALINYGAGVLRLPLLPFIASTMIGMAAKSLLYASAVHALAETASPAALLRFDVLAPLCALMLVAGIGRWVMARRQRPDSPGRGKKSQ